MLIALGHGGRLLWATADEDASALAAAAVTTEPGAVPVDIAIPDAPDPSAIAAAADPADPISAERFGYLVGDIESFPAVDKAAALDTLAAAMSEGPEGDDGPIPAIMTYFGQFIDHDITANTNTERAELQLQIGVEPIVPQSRAMIEADLRNMRRGSLQLDSVYGDGPIDGPATQKMMAALREGDRMRVGATFALNGTAVPIIRPALPAPDADGVLADLPRVGDLVGPNRPYADPGDLPAGLKPTNGGDRWRRKAFIGDSRNDENLIVAQFHVAMLRFHNAVLKALGTTASFEEARRLVTWHYQWLILKAYLPSICDPYVVASVLEQRAPVYAAFLSRLGLKDSGTLPLPLEFSAAAFRFGHSMVRADYDYNVNFGSPTGQRATLEQLFQFTGNDPISPIGGAGFAQLPDNWIIEWQRFTGVSDPGRNARKIDTHIAPPLFGMVNEGGAANGLFQRLAARNLRRGHVLNLPPAQALIAKLNAEGFGPITALSSEELRSGATGTALEAGDFVEATPLWFYVLKEAEVQANGERLGALGSRIVAETLIGLLINDPSSFLNADGGWDPGKSVKPGGVVVDNLAALLEVAGVA